MSQRKTPKLKIKYIHSEIAWVFLVLAHFIANKLKSHPMGKTYVKVHKTTESVKGHVKNIKARGGSAKVDGKKVTYTFDKKKA